MMKLKKSGIHAKRAGHKEVFALGSSENFVIWEGDLTNLHVPSPHYPRSPGVNFQFGFSISYFAKMMVN